eukprot:14582252-Alexandrium_andersonii.AAC.1
MDEPTPFGRYLGCDHITGEWLSPITGRRVRVLEYDMSEFRGHAKAHLSKRKVGAPFAYDAKKFVLGCGGHCARCGA